MTRERFAPALLSTEQAVLQAAASRDIRRAEALAPRRAYDSYSALLRDPDVDAVYVATHNGLHKELAIEALQCGKHVLCEKPLGCTAEECEAMVATAAATQRLLVEAFMYRHHPQTKLVGEWLREGRMGEIRLVRAAFSFFMGESSIMSKSCFRLIYFHVMFLVRM